MKKITVTVSMTFDYTDVDEADAIADAKHYIQTAGVSASEFDYSIQTLDTDS